ncbi:MAG: hypothetical protein HFI22_12795, partial [Lachnospiraceae bacterium]|nr:hypothetical protein [Lachnospiraceae bacterium]
MKEILEKMDFKLSSRHFGPLWKYIRQDEITNVDWDSGQLWIKYANRTRKRVYDPEITEEFIHRFSLIVANHESRPFHRLDSILSAETEQLRITFVHEAFAVSGRSMSIRKSLPRRLYHKDRRKPFWTFTISFEEAQAFRRANGG